MADNLALVTGAAGFIGSNVTAQLAQRGYKVAACDRFQYDETWRYLAPYLLYDVIRPDEALDWLTRHADQAPLIVHMGAISATTERDLNRIIDNNVRLTLDLWDAAASAGSTFIYASSAATYGDGSEGFVDDDAPTSLARLRPLNPYGWSKHLVDRRIIDDVTTGRSSPPRWAGLKFFNVFGPNEGHKGSMRSVVHQIYPLAARGETVKLFKSDNPDYEDGGQLRDFVYVKDCVAAIMRMVDQERLSGIYNLGTGQARSFADLARAVFAAVGKEPRIEYIDMPEQLLGKYQYFTQADTQKLRGAHLAPAFHTLEDAVQDYVASHLRLELG